MFDPPRLHSSGKAPRRARNPRRAAPVRTAALRSCTAGRRRFPGAERRGEGGMRAQPAAPAPNAFAPPRPSRYRRAMTKPETGPDRRRGQVDPFRGPQHSRRRPRIPRARPQTELEKPMRRRLAHLATATSLAALTAGAAAAHTGHIAEVAGHTHWVAGAAIGLAVLVGLWGRRRDRDNAAPEDEAEAASEESEA